MPNANTMLDAISTAAQQSGRTYITTNATVTINFLSDGTMNVTNTTTNTSHPTYGWTNHNMPIPSNGALFVTGGNARVMGTLKGKVTLGTDTNIYIGGNLLYNTDPRVHPESTDLMAMVSKNNVYIEDLGSSRPKNIEVDGYIVAMNQFLVQNFWTFAAGNLIQYGGLTTTLPGGLTGLFDPGSGQVIFGYNQLQYFDERLESLAPLWFPPMMDSNNHKQKENPVEAPHA